MPMRVSAKGRRFMDMPRLAQQFAQTVPAVQKKAAEEATSVSRATFASHLNERGRPEAPPRPGRPTTLGRFASDILWESNLGMIDIDMRRLPIYALIQEIGTGETAKILNPQGEVTVRSQIGRRISANLYWGTAVGGTAVPARRGASGEQLFYASELSNIGNVRRRQKRIHRNIKGKHFLRAGGQAGMVQLRTGLVDEAKRIFR